MRAAATYALKMVNRTLYRSLTTWKQRVQSFKTRRVMLARFHMRMKKRAAIRALNQWKDKVSTRSLARATVARLAISASRSYKQWALSRWAKTSAKTADRGRCCRQLVIRF